MNFSVERIQIHLISLCLILWFCCKRQHYPPVHCNRVWLSTSLFFFLGKNLSASSRVIRDTADRWPWLNGWHFKKNPMWKCYLTYKFHCFNRVTQFFLRSYLSAFSCKEDFKALTKSTWERDYSHGPFPTAKSKTFDCPNIRLFDSTCCWCYWTLGNAFLWETVQF